MGMPRRPDQAFIPPAAPVAPSSQSGLFFGRRVIVFGPGSATGVFVYSPTVALGNLIASMSASMVGPEGETITPIIATYGSNNQILAMQQIFGFARLIYYSGAASEAAAANLYNVVFSRGGAAEQIGTFLTGAESTASPIDKVQLDLYGSPANAANSATGYFEYDQAAGSPPALVQSAQGVSVNSTTTTVTLSAAATLGNCLIVTVQGDSTTGANPSVTGITIGGSADNFASVVTDTGSITRAEIWNDPNIGHASTSVVVTTTAATGAAVNVTVMEWSGLAAASPADQTSTNTPGAGASWTSGNTPGVTVAGEIAVGVVATEQTGGTITGPGAPWTNVAQLSTGQAICLSGSMALPSLAGVAYSGTFGASAPGYTALVATFKPAASATGVLLRPASWGAKGFGVSMASQLCAAQPGTSGGTLVSETWHNLPIAAGFTFGTVGPAYRFEAVGSAGQVRLRGNIKLTANQAAGATFATLPVGWRWSNVPQAFNTVNNLSGWAVGNGSVLGQASGVLQIGSSGVTNNVVWLDDVVLPLD